MAYNFHFMIKLSFAMNIFSIFIVLVLLLSTMVRSSSKPKSRSVVRRTTKHAKQTNQQDIRNVHRRIKFLSEHRNRKAKSRLNKTRQLAKAT